MKGTGEKSGSHQLLTVWPPWNWTLNGWLTKKSETKLYHWCQSWSRIHTNTVRLKVKVCHQQMFEGRQTLGNGLFPFISDDCTTQPHEIQPYRHFWTISRTWVSITLVYKMHYLENLNPRFTFFVFLQVPQILPLSNFQYCGFGYVPFFFLIHCPLVAMGGMYQSLLWYPNCF